MKYLLLLLVIQACLCSKPEYYSILGLRRGSSIKQIKKAFKKFAIKYHPDRAPAGKKEEYEKKFQKVSDAYSILSDKKKKSVYDRFGHKGLERQEQEEAQNSQWEARKERQESRMNEDIFRESDVLKLDVESLGKFYRRIGVWVVLFYRGSEPESKQFKQMMDQLFDKFYGIFTVAAANCEVDEEICEEFRALDTPALMVFNHDSNREPERYTGDRSVGRVAGYAASFLEDYVRVITEENIDDFIQKNQHRPKIILLTNKRSTPPVLKVLSKEFKDSAAFGLIKNNPKLMSLFGDLQPPKILSLGGTLEERTLYEGGFKKADISVFVREKIHDYEAPESTNSKPIVRVTQADDLGKAQCSQKFKHLCLLVLTRADSEEQVKQALKEVSIYFEKDPIAFAYIRREMIDHQTIEFERNRGSFGDFSEVKMLLLKPAKRKINFYKGNMDKESIKNFLDMVMSGSSRFLKLKEHLEDYMYEIDEVDL